ncbi:TetR/AcrR family transcriptional regulator [Paenibacillus sp. Leaf72]|uniref:TetR/AcrR family transcriptional regulator n=1 Tax=Paenibacillus sp. Leaf72 TaxID=1736234 RepID=UPI0009D71588|nr:TetR/AcrR family transcriptional regulator [Paenibacillus sp. Leaf72]
MESALKRFALYGYHSTKVSDIVADAGVAQGTFYWYFKSKEAIAIEIVQDGRERLLTVIGQGYRKNAGSVQDMVSASEHLLTELFHFAKENRYLMGMLLDGTGFSEVVRQEITVTQMAMEQSFVNNIERATELGMLPATIDAKLRAAFLMSLIEGVLSRWLFRSTPESDAIAVKSAELLAAETARFEFFGLLGI